MNRADCLNTASNLVSGERDKQYGSPGYNFSNIAATWSWYKGVEFTANDVAIMMALLKIARLKTGTPKEDSYIDAAGYIACGCEIGTEKTDETNVGVVTYRGKDGRIERVEIPEGI